MRLSIYLISLYKVSMENKNGVTLTPEGYVEEKWIGPQTRESVELLTQESHGLARQLLARGQNALVLVDSTDVESATSGARSAAIKALSNSEFEKIAIVSRNNLWDLVIKVTLKITKRADRSKVFHDHEEAVQWLLGE